MRLVRCEDAGRLLTSRRCRCRQNQWGWGTWGYRLKRIEEDDLESVRESTVVWGVWGVCGRNA